VFVLETNFPKLPQVPSELVKSRAKVIRLVHLYSFKFGDLFLNYIQIFFTKIWGLIESDQLLAVKKNEKLVAEVVRYLSEMAT